MSIRKYMNNRLLVTLMCILCCTHILVAQNKPTKGDEHRLVTIFFRQGSHAIDESYMGNKQILETFAQEVKACLQDTTLNFRRIRVVASASPEGTQQINDKLGKKRAEAITNWVSEKISTKLGYEVEFTGIDWESLANFVRESDDLPYRDEVLEIINRQEEGASDTRLKSLQKLHNGVPYQWMYKNLFPRMRNASARVEFWWETQPPVLTITSPSPIHMPYYASNGVITFRKNKRDGVIPEALEQADWLTLTHATNDSIFFRVAENLVAEPRSTKVQLTYFDNIREVEVIQAGADPMLTITTESPIRHSAEAGQGIVTFTRNTKDTTAPVITHHSDWITDVAYSDNQIHYQIARNKETVERIDTVEIACYGQTHKVAVIQEGAELKPFYMALKTNALYDIALIPNMGVEFYLGKNFSIAGNWHYTWIRKTSIDWFHRTYGGDLAVRYWFGKKAEEKPLTGHHVGLYGQMITYDFEYGGRGYLADRWSWAGGIEYGYSMPIAKRLNIDFTIGLGYHWGEYKEYLPIDGHYVWQATKNRSYFGPTKAEVSLVWLLGRGNYNKRK